MNDTDWDWAAEIEFGARGGDLASIRLIWIGGGDFRPTGRRRRIVNVERLAEELVARARETGRRVVAAEHGGTVPNCYGYPARTDAVLLVAYPDGTVVVGATSIPANKATVGGAADAVYGPARPLFDARYGADAKAEALEATLEMADRVRQASDGSTT